MTPEQALEAVAEAIHTRKIAATKNWAIVWSAGRFLCVPAQTSAMFEFTFTTLPDDTILNGLTQPQWNKLIAKVSIFLQQKGLI